MINIRNESGDITTESEGIKKIIKEFYEQFYSHNPDNLDEMDQFLKKHKLPKRNEDEINNHQTTITIKDTEFTINNFPRKNP